MKKPIASATRTKEILTTYDLHPKKGFGQNFLIEPSIAKRIAERIPENNGVIEIGPGIGGLSEQLLERVAYLECYEIDTRLIPVLEDVLQDYTNVTIHQADILKVDIEEALVRLKETYGGVSVAANLPYYITSPVLFAFFQAKADIDTIIVMVQKEVGERFLAKPNTDDYGSLSVEGQYLFEIERVCNANRNSFYPAPKVDSVVVAFKKREDVDKDNAEAFFTFVRTCFKQRRKTLLNNLKESAYDMMQVEGQLDAMHKTNRCRAQELSVEELYALYQALENK